MSRRKPRSRQSIPKISKKLLIDLGPHLEGVREVEAMRPRGRSEDQGPRRYLRLDSSIVHASSTSVLALLRGYAIRLFDIRRHSFTCRTIIWLLKRAMHGLRSSPRYRQIHFARTIRERGFVRIQSDANTYVHFERLAF